VKVNPVGFGSCTPVPKIGPGLQAAVPTFVIASVMVACCPLTTGLGLTVFLMDRSHFPSPFGVSKNLVDPMQAVEAMPPHAFVTSILAP